MKWLLCILYILLDTRLLLVFSFLWKSLFDLAWINIANERDFRLNHIMMIIKTHNHQHKDESVARRLNNFWLCAVFILHYQWRCYIGDVPFEMFLVPLVSTTISGETVKRMENMKNNSRNALHILSHILSWK